MKKNAISKEGFKLSNIQKLNLMSIDPYFSYINARNQAERDDPELPNFRPLAELDKCAKQNNGPEL